MTKRGRLWVWDKQEATQRGRWKVVQPREIPEHSVLSQQLGRLNPFETKDHRMEQGQHLDNAVPMVALVLIGHLWPPHFWNPIR